MYSDRTKRKARFLVPLLCALAAAAVILACLRIGGDVSEEGAAAIREAVRRSALQCYVVEGAYPPDLQYLEDSYGLQINTEDYYVVYECFASNLPPTIRVVSRGA